MIILREAELRDMKIVFDWANEAEARKNSFNSDLIEWSTHEKWFIKKIDDPSTIILIAEYGEPIGQIRFDRKGNKAMISFLVSAENRNLGFGEEIVKKGTELIWTLWSDVKEVYAEVKPDNIYSKRIFDKLGFIRTDTDCIEYRKLRGG